MLAPGIAVVAHVDEQGRVEQVLSLEGVHYAADAVIDGQQSFHVLAIDCGNVDLIAEGDIDAVAGVFAVLDPHRFVGEVARRESHRLGRRELLASVAAGVARGGNKAHFSFAARDEELPLLVAGWK